MKNYTHQILAMILISVAWASCSLTHKEVVGNYVNPTYGDTLYIRADQSYEYAEKLNSGTIGWTEGKWHVQKRKIQFKCDHKPLVGYRRKILPDSSTSKFQIQLLLADTRLPIYIEEVKILKGAQVLGASSYKKENNVVTTFTKDFDSIILYTFNFPPMTFKGFAGKERGYVVRIYPVERLYELDKVPFLIRRTRIRGVGSKPYDQRGLSFKKLKNVH